MDEDQGTHSDEVVLRDPKTGDVRAALGFRKNGEPALEFYSKDGAPMLQLGVDELGPYVALGVLGDGRPSALLRLEVDSGRLVIGATDHRGEAVFSAGIDEEGRGRLHMEPSLFQFPQGKQDSD